MDETVEIQSSEKTVGLEFYGKGSDYFKIWIVNILLTIITFGIYSPWAKIRARKYLNGVTQFDGNSFDYHAKPIPLLIGRVLAGIVFGVYVYGAFIHPFVGILGTVMLYLLLPFFLIKSYRFNFANTSLKNIRFSLKTRIDETYKIYFKLLGLPLFVNILLLCFSTYSNWGKTEAEIALGIKEGDMTLVIVGIVNLILLVYVIRILPKILNQFLSSIYNNAFFGNIPIFIKTSEKAIKTKVLIPYVKYFMITLFFGLIGVVGASVLIVKVPFLAPAAILIYILFYISILIASIHLPYLIFKYVWNNLGADCAKVSNKLNWKEYRNLSVKNAILSAITLGLYYPFARISILKLKAEARQFKISNYEAISNNTSEKQSAVTDEISDAFDIDIDFGL